jgi:hypothetical protein
LLTFNYLRVSQVKGIERERERERERESRGEERREIHISPSPFFPNFPSEFRIPVSTLEFATHTQKKKKKKPTNKL